jgi:ribosome-binding ATPase YchF (GTP1/OBG family)
VFVHVVDATGRSDRDGNVLSAGERGSSPSEDAQWIREELHRWVYIFVYICIYVRKYICILMVLKEIN